MKSFNRIAVVLAGELRTWETASKYLFNFFDSLADNVDYFFVTWNVSSQTGELINITDQDVVPPFQQYNKNIVAYKILEPIGKHKTTFYNQAWLSKVGNILKRKHEAENNFIYDQVIETRPDCYFRGYDSKAYTSNTLNLSQCGNFEYEGDLPFVNNLNHDFFGIADVYFRFDSLTSDIFAERYYFSKSSDMNRSIKYTHGGFDNHHLTMIEFLYKRMMKPCTNRKQSDFQFFCCIRPSFPKDLDLDTLPPMKLDEMFISYVKQDQNFFYGPKSNLPIVDH
jgi:hypothetical protein